MRQIVEIIEPKPKFKDFITNQVIRKKKVAAYARVSTDETDQFHSYQAQIEEFTQRINKNDEWEFAGMYCDEGITGTMMSKRPGFLSMIQAAEDGHIDLILTKSISRFSRNTIDILTVIQTLRNINVEIFFEKENLSSLDPKIDFILTVMSSMAQEESRSISENTKWGIQKRFEQGKLIMNTNRFLGYDKDKEGTLIINEEQAKTVKYIFHKYLNGMSITSLARHLTDEKIKNGLGRVNWYSDTVKELLMNEKYAGDLMLQKTVTIDYLTHQAVINDGHATKYYIKNAHEPIIDRETFNIVQIMIHARDAILSEDSKERFKHLAHKPMKGLVYCSRCHRIYNSKMYNSGTTFKKSMLKCHTSRNNPHNCDNPSIHEPLLERATLHVIERLTQAKDMQKSIMDYMKETLEQTNSHEPLKALKHEYVEIGNQIKALSKNQLHSYMTDLEYKREFKRLEQNLKDTELNIENLINQIKKNISCVDVITH